MKVKNYYKLLGIESNTNLDDIKKAFRDKIAIHHPDINTSKDAEKQFDNLVEAFDILSKPDKRKLYDELLDNESTASTTEIDIKKEEVFKEWKKDAKQKSKKFKEKNQDNSLGLDIFSDVLIEGLLENAEGFFDGAGDIISDIIGDIL